MGPGKIAGYAFTVIIPLVVGAMIPHIGLTLGLSIIAVSMAAGIADFVWLWHSGKRGKPSITLLEAQARADKAAQMRMKEERFLAAKAASPAPQEPPKPE